MASSGSFNTSAFTATDGTRYLTFSWEETNQNPTTNKTTINWTLKGGGTSTQWIMSGNFKVVIEGKTVYSSASRIKLLQGTTVASGTYTITHDADGKGDFTASAEAGIYYSAVNCSGSKTFTLDTIARASTITSAANVTLGNKCSVKWTPKASSFRYKLKFSLGNWSYTTGAIHPNKTTAYTYTGYAIPLKAAEQIPDKKTATMKVALYTYSNSGATTQIGSADTEEFTVTVPDNASTKPSISMTLSPVSDLAEEFSGVYIQGKTKVKAFFSAEGKYNAEIDSCGMKIENSTYLLEDDYTSNFLSQYGEIPVEGYAKDSRGYTTTVTDTITVIGYSKPMIQAATGESDVIAARCDADGNLTESGTYLKIKAKRSYSFVEVNGEQKNFCEIRYRYKKESASSFSSWYTILAGDSLESNEVETGALLAGGLSAQATYVVEVGVADRIGGTAYTTISVPTDKVYSHEDGARNSFAFGKYCEEDNTFEIAEDITFKARGPVVASGEKWVNLGLSSSVSVSSEDIGRAAQSECCYRIVNGNHIYAAFNCAFTNDGEPVTVSGSPIPEKYRPGRKVYELCAFSGTGFARVFVDSLGNIGVDQVNGNPGSVSWIDGYIDYFI